MDRAEQARHYRHLFRNLADLLDEGLAEAERLGEALDFPLGRFGRLLIELGAGAHALRRHLAGRSSAVQAEARRGPRRRLKDHPAK
jgi:hypothetical protein